MDNDKNPVVDRGFLLFSRLPCLITGSDNSHTSGDLLSLSASPVHQRGHQEQDSLCGGGRLWPHCWCHCEPGGGRRHCSFILCQGEPPQVPASHHFQALRRGDWELDQVGECGALWEEGGGSSWWWKSQGCCYLVVPTGCAGLRAMLDLCRFKKGKFWIYRGWNKSSEGAAVKSACVWSQES